MKSLKALLSNKYVIIIAVVILLITSLIVNGILLSKNSNKNSVIKDRDKTITALTTDLNDCLKAITTSDTTEIIQNIKSVIKYYPKPVYIYLKDTTKKEVEINYDDLPIAEYQDTAYMDRHSISWSAEVAGRLNWINFDNLSCKFNQITNSTVIYKTDTIKEHIPTNHWILDLGLVVNSFDKFPGLKTEIQHTVKDRFGFGIGGIYINDIDKPMKDNLYVVGSVKLFLK